MTREALLMILQDKVLHENSSLPNKVCQDVLSKEDNVTFCSFSLAQHSFAAFSLPFSDCHICVNIFLITLKRVSLQCSGLKHSTNTAAEISTRNSSPVHHTLKKRELNVIGVVV